MKKLMFILVVVSLFTSFVVANGIMNADGDAYTVLSVSSDPGTAVYSDSSNEDTGLVLCGLGSTNYAGAVYGANVSGNFTSVLISVDNANSVSLSQIDQDKSVEFGAGCYGSINARFMFPTLSYLGYSIPAYKPAFPGNTLIRYSSSASGTGADNYVYTNGNSELSGSYSLGSMSFDQVIRDVDLSVSTINYGGAVGSKSISDSFYGFDNTNNNKAMVIAICNDQNGLDCSDATIVNDTTQFPVSLDSGLSAMDVNDQSSYDKYGVINGLGHSICIGPQLQINSVYNDAGGPLLSSETANVTVKVKNIGNVDVTTDFNVTVTGANLNHVEEITDTLVPNVEYTFTVNDVLPGPASGSYAYTAQVRDLDAGIASCGSDSHSSFTSLTVSNIIFPQIWINGVLDGNFTNAGMINNLTIQLNDSDGSAPGDFANWTLMIFEINGNTLLAPVQSGDNGNNDYLITPFSVARITLDDTGYGSFTVSPGSSPILLDDQNYSLIFSISNTSNDKQHMSYQGTILNVDDCGVGANDDPFCGLPFGFDDPSFFPGDLTMINYTHGEWHNTTSPNGDHHVGAVWEKIRMIALQLTNLLNV